MILVIDIPFQLPAETRPVRTHLRYEVASCSAFTPLPTNTTLPGPLPYMPSLTNTSIETKGAVRLWYFQSSG